MVASLNQGKVWILNLDDNNRKPLYYVYFFQRLRGNSQIIKKRELVMKDYNFDHLSCVDCRLKKAATTNATILKVNFSRLPLHKILNNDTNVYLMEWEQKQEIGEQLFFFFFSCYLIRLILLNMPPIKKKKEKRGFPPPWPRSISACQIL